MTVFGEAVDYCDLQTLLRQRAQALRLTMESIDKTAGFADALASQILQPFPIKSALGPQTLGPLLTVLGLKIALIEDPEALERVRRHSQWQEQRKGMARRNRPPGRFTDMFIEKEIERRLAERERGVEAA